MQTICALLGGLLMFFVTPIMLLILIIFAILKKPVKKIGIATAICAGGVLFFGVLTILTNPDTWCKHEYEITKEIAATCTEKGEIHKTCSLCKDEKVEHTEKIGHSWELEKTVEATCSNAGYVTERCSMCNTTQNRETSAQLAHKWETDGAAVEATCVSSGYITERCIVCHTSQKKETTPALGHSMKEVSRVEPTRQTEGKIISRCERCDHEETQKIDKLPPVNYIEGVSFDEIYKAYEENPLRADDVYKGKRYKVTGVIYSMYNDGIYGITGGATLMLTTKIGNTHFYFYAEFDKEQEEALKKVNVKDTITFEGECVSSSNWVKCKLITE